MPSYRHFLALAASTALLAVAGCSNTDGGQATSNDDHAVRPVDASILEVGGSVNAGHFDNPSDMARDRDVVVVGEIAGFEDGAESIEHAGGYDIVEHTVVIEIKVTSSLKGAVGADSVYVSVSRGAEQVGGEDDGGGSTVAPVSAFEEALPVGSEVIVMANPVTTSTEQGVEVVDANRGVPNGGLLLRGTHPQAMTFPGSDGGTTAWRGRVGSFDDVVTEVEDAT